MRGDYVRRSNLPVIPTKVPLGDLQTIYGVDRARLLPTASATLRGKAEIGRFLEAGARSRPIDLCRWHRSDTFFSVGDTLIWEYPRPTPEGDQVEIVEVMSIANCLIRHHRIYWGWKGCLLVAPKLAQATERS